MPDIEENTDYSEDIIDYTEQDLIEAIAKENYVLANGIFVDLISEQLLNVINEYKVAVAEDVYSEDTLDELSKKTLGSYGTKAANSLSKSSSAATRAAIHATHRGSEPKTAKKHYKVVNKRLRGLDLLAKRTNKPEISKLAKKVDNTGYKIGDKQSDQAARYGWPDRVANDPRPRTLKSIKTGQKINKLRGRKIGNLATS